MAKEVNLTRRPPVSPQRPDLSQLSTPPPAQPVAAALQRPLPTGKVLSATGHEIPAPAHIQQQAQAFMQQESGKLPDGYDESFVARPMEVVDIAQLDPSQQAQVHRVLQETLAQAAAPAAPGQKGTPLPTLHEILRRPAPAPTPLPPPPAPAVQAAPPPPPVEQAPLEGWTVAPPQEAPPDAPSVPGAIPGDNPAEPLETVGGELLTRCPHCERDLTDPAVPEPAYAEKQMFIQSILGQKPFHKEYTLLGGSLRVTFRTLTTREVDTIYKQAFREREEGKQATTEDFWEVVNRYRLYLQLIRMESDAFLHDLPDGYDELTNPHATAFYKFDPPENPKETGLPMIADYMEADILRTESLQRIVNIACSRFNRLVAKLEGVVDNSDFWKPTEGQS